ncbi:hypothetical protein GCM10029992_21430 [Glycomyces albus]
MDEFAENAVDWGAEVTEDVLGALPEEATEVWETVAESSSEAWDTVSDEAGELLE